MKITLPKQIYCYSSELFLLGTIRGIVTMAVCLSYFHRKLGPVVQCTSPGDFLPEVDMQSIAGLMDKVYVKDNFLINAVGGDKAALNYFFEIPSPWSHQNKELLMLSVISSEKNIVGRNENDLRVKMKDFVEKLKSDETIFKGFYFQDRKHFQSLLRKQILTGNATLQRLVSEFHRTVDTALEFEPIKGV